MTNTVDLIKQLSADAKPSKAIGSPFYWGIRLLFVLAVYLIAAQAYLGIRPDLEAQLTRPVFVLELALLLFLLVSSSVASILAMYPDAYQKPQLLKLPYLAFSMLFGLLTAQLFIPADAGIATPAPGGHGMECALCIAELAIIPSALIFVLLRKGASIHQLQAGGFAVLAATAIGCLTLRMAEDNDLIIHLVTWHYLPTILFAALGALLGKLLLKW